MIQSAFFYFMKYKLITENPEVEIEIRMNNIFFNEDDSGNLITINIKDWEEIKYFIDEQIKKL
jgi:hypothetical protein